MALRLNYIGNSDIRIVSRATMISKGLTDPGLDLVWTRANGYELNVSNDVCAYLLASGGDFATDGMLNFGQVLGEFTPGPVGAFQGEYNPAQAYVANDVVTYKGSSFICTIGGTGTAPPEDDEIATTIIGPAGADGAPGPAGIQGPQGNPGAAGAAGQGVEIGYTEVTSTVSNATGAAVDIVSILNVNTTGKVAVIFSGLMANDAAGHGSAVYLYEDGVLVDLSFPIGTGAGLAIRLTTITRRNPAAGLHTYTMKFVHFNSGNSTCIGSVNDPISLSVVTR